MINRLTTALNLNRLTGMISTPSGGGQLPFSYGASYNEANQRITVTMNDGSYWVYEYNTLGQISSAKKHFSDGAFVPGQQFTYSYDHIGNRSTTRAGGDQNGSLSGDGYSYYVDGFLNQYTTRYRPYPVHVTGAADPDETVYVNGAQVAYRNGEYFWKELSYVSTLATWFKIEVATSGCETNVGHVFLPSRPEYFTYDLDGNMVSSSRWNYTWDAENRLTSMTDNTTCTNDVPKRIVFEYDYQGRRIAKKVWNNTAGTGNPATYLKYLYDGWNLIAELNGNSGNALVRSYTWGLDASGSMQGAGGVGGLLMVNAGTNGVHFPAYDLNGNVMGLVNATNGMISAKYEYGPFGEVFCSVGDMAKVNPFGFSTKYTDNETDLVYYGYRYYSPALGRWLSRDPIEEKGGLNLYGFVNNDPVNKWDLLGLQAEFIRSLHLENWRTPKKGGCLATIREANSMLGQLTNDKRAHCVYSCEISKSCGKMIACFLGDLKEARDLFCGCVENDLSKYSQSLAGWIQNKYQGGTIDESAEDFEANRYGLQIAKDGKDCIAECEKRYGVEDNFWNYYIK